MKKHFLFILISFSLFSLSFAKSDSLLIELVKIYPDPFHDFLKFEFQVADTSHHIVTIKISDNENGIVFLEKVPVYSGHETITINTIDFFTRDFFSIMVQTDRHHKIVKRFRRY